MADTTGRKSNLDLVNDCDRFPYPDAGNRFSSQHPDLYTFYLEDGGQTYPAGYMLHSVVDRMPWNPAWNVNRVNRTVRMQTDIDGVHNIQRRNQSIKQLLEYAVYDKRFKVLEKWRNELYPICGMSGKVAIERAGSPLFGINSYGVHLTAYVKDGDQMKIWVPRRAAEKQTYGGMLDNTVAGGISVGETPMECLVREADEEASFPADLIRGHAKPVGTVSYFMIRDKRAGGEEGLMQPECQFVYDLEVDKSVIPKPNDDEVEEFALLSVEKVQEAMAEGQFKPNCAMVLLDFFVRHAILTPDNEADYAEIVSRLHRKLPFQTR